MEYTPGQVISLEFEKSSFSWSNGLYVVIEVKDKELRICQLDEKGQMHLIDNKPSISCTSVDNPAVKSTNLSYKFTI